MKIYRAHSQRSLRATQRPEMADLRVPQLKRQLAAKDEQLAQKDALLAAQEQELGELREQLAQKQRKIEALMQGAAESASASTAPPPVKKAGWRSLMPKLGALRSQSASAQPAGEQEREEAAARMQNTHFRSKELRDFSIWR